MTKTKEIGKIDKKYLWHPFTQMEDWLANDQIFIERGKGVFLYDTDGNKYIDGVSSLWVTVHGHNKKEINSAITEQLKNIAHSTLLGLGSAPSALLAKKLVEISPEGLTKVFYSDSGSTAVEIALKIAFQYWQRKENQKLKTKNPKFKTKFVTLENAYHGDTIGSVSVGGIDLFHRIYKPLLFKSIKVRPGDINQLESVFKNHHPTIAAMIVEPLIQAAAGMLLMPKGYLKAVRGLCAKYDVLLICDEVAAGFGRTGKMFACEHEQISPDIMCAAKGLSGGYLPVAATLTTEKIYKAFLGKLEENKAFFHGHTFTGNPLACAAAIASLNIYKKERVLQHIGRLIPFLNQKLIKFKTLKTVKEVRQLGMMAGIELYPLKPRLGRQVIIEARKRGAILRPLGNVIVLMPPLSISKSELAQLLKITYDSIEVLQNDN